MTNKSVSIEQQQTPDQISQALESFLAEFPDAVLMEDGKVLFDMREARYSVSTEYARCTLHLWSPDRNLVRRVSAADRRKQDLRLQTWKFGQSKPQALELAGDKDRRTPSTREATRVRFVRILQRALERQFPDWHCDSFSTAMDLEKSFGPAYARGLMLQGRKAWAVIAINADESPALVDGILTFGILWLQYCREHSGGKRQVQGLRVVVPIGMAATTLSRIPWLAGSPEQWELWELAERSEELTQRDPTDHGNLATRILHAPNLASAKARFANSAVRVLSTVPIAFQSQVEQRIRSGHELGFLLHGLEFARIRTGTSAQGFNRIEQITFGAGASETELTAATEPTLRSLVARLCERRSPTADKRDPLYRMQPERWLEGQLRLDVTLIDAHLDASHVHTQVPAFAGVGDRAMLDLLGISNDGRLAVVEVKADEDPQLALQGLDYWIRVRWHQQQHPDPVTGLGEFQRHGYFGGLQLSNRDPRLFLVAPALRIHPSTEIVLRHMSPRVEWTLLALGEKWREQVKVIWRRRSTDLGG